MPGWVKHERGRKREREREKEKEREGAREGEKGICFIIDTMRVLLNSENWNPVENCLELYALVNCCTFWLGTISTLKFSLSEMICCIEIKFLTHVPSGVWMGEGVRFLSLFS